jgi:hypothetical protein
MTRHLLLACKVVSCSPALRYQQERSGERRESMSLQYYGMVISRQRVSGSPIVLDAAISRNLCYMMHSQCQTTFTFGSICPRGAKTIPEVRLSFKVVVGTWHTRCGAQRGGEVRMRFAFGVRSIENEQDGPAHRLRGSHRRPSFVRE